MPLGTTRTNQSCCCISVCLTFLPFSIHFALFIVHNQRIKPYRKCVLSQSDLWNQSLSRWALRCHAGKVPLTLSEKKAFGGNIIPHDVWLIKLIYIKLKKQLSNQCWGRSGGQGRGVMGLNPFSTFFMLRCLKHTLKTLKTASPTFQISTFFRGSTCPQTPLDSHTFSAPKSKTLVTKSWIISLSRVYVCIPALFDRTYYYLDFANQAIELWIMCLISCQHVRWISLQLTSGLMSGIKYASTSTALSVVAHFHSPFLHPGMILMIWILMMVQKMRLVSRKHLKIVGHS